MRLGDLGDLHDDPAPLGGGDGLQKLLISFLPRSLELAAIGGGLQFVLGHLSFPGRPWRPLATCILWPDRWVVGADDRRHLSACCRVDDDCGRCLHHAEHERRGRILQAPAERVGDVHIGGCVKVVALGAEMFPGDVAVLTHCRRPGARRVYIGDRARL